MALFQNTAIELVERTARILRDWKGGTCTNGGASTFVDTSRTEADDYFQNTVPVSRVRIITTTDGAAPLGQERTISDWVNSTGTGTVSATWTTSNPGAGDTYCIMTEYSWGEIFHAINDAIDSVKKLIVLEKVDNSISLVASTYEYDIPVGFTHIYRVSMEDSSGRLSEPVPPDHYKIIRGTPTPRLHFIRFPTEFIGVDINYTGLWADTSLTAGRELRIEGFGSQETLVKDTDLCYLDPLFIINQVAAFLHARRITSTATDYNEHRTQYQVCQAEADRRKPKATTSFPPNTKRLYL